MSKWEGIDKVKLENFAAWLRQGGEQVSAVERGQGFLWQIECYTLDQASLVRQWNVWTENRAKEESAQRL
jgi:hypothetical protein